MTAIRIEHTVSIELMPAARIQLRTTVRIKCTRVNASSQDTVKDNSQN